MNKHGFLPIPTPAPELQGREYYILSTYGRWMLLQNTWSHARTTPNKCILPVLQTSITHNLVKLKILVEFAIF